MADDIFVSNDIQLDVDFGEIFVIDQGVVTKVVAKKYDPTKTYVVGEYVIYQEKLYKCNTAIEEPEEFDAEKWNNVLLADEVQIANANIALKANISDVYEKSETYNKTEVDTALESKADANTTYSKTEVDTALATKADTATTYTKTEVDTALSAKANSTDVDTALNLKADKSTTYTKTEVDTALANKADKSTTYTKTEVDTSLSGKADKSDTYTKTEVDTALSVKANSDDVYAKTDTYSKDEIDTGIYKKTETYNKNEVDGIINNLPAPMIFKGTLGVNGTITALPTASADNEGYTYKVITDGTYASVQAKVGDMFTSNGTAWVHIPSGDETFTDTWRSIKVNGTEKLSGSITSGSVDFKNGTNSTAVFDPSDNSIKVNVDGYTQAQIDTKLSAKANQADVTTALNNKADKSTTYTKTEVNTALALKADKSTTYTKTEVDNLVNLIGTVSGDICTFETTLPEPLQSVLVNVVASQPSGTPTPSTPLPITGYSSANITRCGVNLWEPDNTCIGKNFDGYANVKRYSQTIKMPLTTYTFCRKGSFSNFSDVYVGISKKPIGNTLNLNSDTQRYSISSDTYKTVTTTAEYPYLFILAITNQDEMTETIMNELQLMISVGSSVPTAYEAYNGQTYAIAFGQTVYGGMLDVTRGKLTVTWGGLVLDTLNWIKGNRNTDNTGYTFYANISAIENPMKVNGDLKCECFAKNSNYGASWEATGVNEIRLGSSNNANNLVCCGDYADANALKTAIDDFIIAYELATPFDIDLTPEVISAIVGENNVFADCGSSTVEFVNSNAEDTVDIAKSVIEQTNLSDLADIPNPPTTDGNYRLKVTILSGKATYSWEEIT